MESEATDPIDHEVENALQLLIKQGQQDLAANIRPILTKNREKGRIEYFTNGQLNRVREYVFRVAEHYQAQCTYLEKIKIERSTEVWGPLFADMCKWSYSHLKRKDFNGVLATVENATECATEASIMLLRAHFPYDTDFKPWAHVIVQNACQKFIQVHYKKYNIAEENLVDIEDLHEYLKDHRSQEDGQTRELRDELRAAIMGLSETRQKVIESLYFLGMSVGELSEQLGKRPSAIHSLHFNALHDLQKILSKTRDNNNE